MWKFVMLVTWNHYIKVYSVLGYVWFVKTYVSDKTTQVKTSQHKTEQYMTNFYGIE